MASGAFLGISQGVWSLFEGGLRPSQCRLGEDIDGRNPAPVDMVNFPLFARFHTCQVVGLGISGCHQRYVSFQGGPMVRRFFVAPTERSRQLISRSMNSWLLHH